MKYKLELTHTAEKFLKNLSEKDYQLVTNALLSLGSDPYQTGVKKLKGRKSLYRLRAGNYRIIYTIDGGKLIVKVVTIGDRKDVYKNK